MDDNETFPYTLYPQDRMCVPEYARLRKRDDVCFDGRREFGFDAFSSTATVFPQIPLCPNELVVRTAYLWISVLFQLLSSHKV